MIHRYFVKPICRAYAWAYQSPPPLPMQIFRYSLVISSVPLSYLNYHYICKLVETNKRYGKLVNLQSYALHTLADANHVQAEAITDIICLIHTESEQQYIDQEVRDEKMGFITQRFLELQERQNRQDVDRESSGRR